MQEVSLDYVARLKRWPPFHFVVHGIWRIRTSARLITSWLRAAKHSWAIFLPRFGIFSARGNTSREIVMLVVSNLHIDPRVEREARALAGAGFKVKIIYPDAYPPHFQEEAIDWGPNVHFRPLPAKAGEYIFNYPYLFGDAMHDAALEERPLAFHCHDLITAPIGLSAAVRCNAYCVCDFHEWWSENVSWDYDKNTWVPHPPEKRILFRLIERLIMWRADVVVTVCDSIADELMHDFARYKAPVAVIRNIPPLKHSASRVYPDLHGSLGLPADQFILIWQGGTGPTRLIEPIIESLQYLPNVTFIIRGPSLEYFGEDYRKLAEKVGVANRLILLPPVPSADVVAAAVSADAGIWTLPKLSKNFYYALPNKIFEYLASGLPVLAANFPEAIKLVANNGVGLCFDPYDPKSIAEQIDRLSSDKALVSNMRDAIPPLLEKIDADNEWLKLVSIYEKLATRP